MSSKSSPKGKKNQTPRTRILKDNTIESVAEYINAGKAKNIIVMSGAGISTAAGIKDFRSPGTGLYSDLAKYNLPYPEAVFDICFFRDNPDPFYRLAKELMPGNYRPTLTHYFMPMLAKRDLLLRAYTQNIDMLERLTGLDGDLLVEAHGSFASSECIDCYVNHEFAWVKKSILKGEVPRCPSCKGLVKPTITFFGEDLPERFGRMAVVDFKRCDLLIVLGTSLQVEPFNRLITRVPDDCPRLLINRERAGEDMHGGFDFDGKHPNQSYLRDAVFLGSCDEGVRKLCKLVGWEGHLQAMHEAGNMELSLAEEMEAMSLAKEIEQTVTETLKSSDEKSDASKKDDGSQTEIAEKITTSTIVHQSSEETVEGKVVEVTVTKTVTTSEDAHSTSTTTAIVATSTTESGKEEKISGKDASTPASQDEVKGKGKESS